MVNRANNQPANLVPANEQANERAHAIQPAPNHIQFIGLNFNAMREGVRVVSPDSAGVGIREQNRFQPIPQGQQPLPLLPIDLGARRAINLQPRPRADADADLFEFRRN